jgi:hypothetical protein
LWKGSFISLWTFSLTPWITAGPSKWSQSLLWSFSPESVGIPPKQSYGDLHFTIPVVEEGVADSLELREYFCRLFMSLNESCLRSFLRVGRYVRLLNSSLALFLFQRFLVLCAIDSGHAVPAVEAIQRISSPSALPTSARLIKCQPHQRIKRDTRKGPGPNPPSASGSSVVARRWGGGAVAWRASGVGR